MIPSRHISSGHVVFISIAALALAASPWLNTLTSSAQIAIALTGIALVGLPHGAADAWLASRLGLVNRPAQAVVFLGGYALLAALVIAVWLVVPVISLAVFLLISAWHFGGDFTDSAKPVLRLSAGTALLGAPAIFWPVAVGDIYEALSGPASAGIVEIQRILCVVAWLVLPVAGLICGFDRTDWRGRVTLAALTLLAVALAPLLWFAVYFCALHAPRHLHRLLADAGADAQRRLIGLAGTMTLVTLIAAITFYLAIMPSSPDIDTALMNIIFVGLAALTVPHMALVDGVLTGLSHKGGAPL